MEQIQNAVLAAFEEFKKEFGETQNLKKVMNLSPYSIIVR